MSKLEDKRKNNPEDERASELIQMMCQARMGVVDMKFLCQSISIISSHTPLTVREGSSLEGAVELIQKNRVGCVLVVDGSENLVGILSERDLVLKVLNRDVSLKTATVDEFMTRDPISQPPDATVAFVLNLMSQGGFRHMPIVDSEGALIGIISVKDVIDAMVASFLDDIRELV